MSKNSFTESILAPRLCDFYFYSLGVAQTLLHLYSRSNFAQSDLDCQKCKLQGRGMLFCIHISLDGRGADKFHSSLRE